MQKNNMKEQYEGVMNNIKKQQKNNAKEQCEKTTQRINIREKNPSFWLGTINPKGFFILLVTT